MEGTNKTLRRERSEDNGPRLQPVRSDFLLGLVHRAERGTRRNFRIAELIKKQAEGFQENQMVTGRL